MAIGLENFFLDIANSPTVNAVFNNPIYTALIIVSVVLLIIYFTMHNDIDIDEDSDTSLTTLMFTSGIYSILAVLGLVYLQHRSLTQEFDRRYNAGARNEVVEATLGVNGRGEKATVDVFNPDPVFHQSLEGSEEDSYYAEEESGTSEESSEEIVNTEDVSEQK